MVFARISTDSFDYYMGQLKYNSFTDTTMKDKDGSDVPVVNIQFDMENPVPQNLYNYLESA